MISSRFNKSKTDQIPETGLNNSESNETPKGADNNLSPHSQLVQRGVYLANSQPGNRNTAATTGYGNNGIDIAKRNQEVRDQIIGQYRERAVDVAHTAGISQQTDSSSPCDGIANGRHAYELGPRPASTSKPTMLDGETPNRYRDHQGARGNPRFEHTQGNVLRNVKRFQDSGDGIVRLNDGCDSTKGKIISDVELKRFLRCS